LGLAIERLRQSEVESKVAILLTDGVHNAGIIDPLKAAELAADQKVKVYCIGAGTNGYAPMPVRDPFSGRTILRPSPVEIDEATLKSIAQKPGGSYFRATDVEALSDVYRQIDQMERTKVDEVRYLNYTEHFRNFLLAAMGFVAVASIFNATFFRRLP
jgi:Ca-activated chloride channel family protein